MNREILCSISTRGRYDTTLPMAMMSVANQTLKPNKLIIFDDNDNPMDVREIQHYQYIFEILSQYGIEWEWRWAGKRGQHYNHDVANNMGYRWVWRMDDDTVAEPGVLEMLYKNTADDVGAVGTAILTTPLSDPIFSTGKLENIYTEPNIQWHYIREKQQVDHLHCSFLYRAGVADYCLSLSRVAHREETLFTWELVKRGYKNFVIPGPVTWHLKNRVGGIRDGTSDLFEHDERIFKNYMQFANNTIVVLDCGMGDHVVFKHVLPHLNNPIVFTCYPNIIPGHSIADAKNLFESIDQWNIYARMDSWNWNQSLESAFRKLYGVR